jgi:hydroxyacylglutathione hydrolase
VYCAHEYTQANIDFALAVEPDNRDLKTRAERVDALRERALPSVPSTIGEELATNPFLRWSAPGIIAAASRRAGRPIHLPVEVFAAIREWKNVF